MRYSYRSSTPVWTLIGINVFIFLITMISPFIADSLTLTKPIFNSAYWTILTAMFVHAGFLHIFFNMLTLYFFGTFCLQLIDAKWFLVVYFVGGIFGNILFLLLAPEYSSVVGASGAIYAIGGVLAAMRPNLKVYLYFFIPVPLWVVVIIGFLVTAPIGNTAWQAHLGGLIVGLLAGLYFRRKEHQRLRPGIYSYR
jgi:membrane associated rhomboid family serine protease